MLLVGIETEPRGTMQTEHDVQQDAEKIGIRNWRNRAQDRTGRRRIVKEAIA